MNSAQTDRKIFYGKAGKLTTLIGACFTLGIFTLSSAALLFAGPQLAGSVDLSFLTESNSHLTATLGISGGVGYAIWDAVNSWWAAALSVLLVPLGFGAWAGTVRLTAQMLIRQLGKEAARKAFLRF